MADIKITVDTTELNEALEKAKELNAEMERFIDLQKRAELNFQIGFNPNEVTVGEFNCSRLVGNIMGNVFDVDV
jgi:hypothetical protein